MEKYSEFEYKKALSALKFVQSEIDSKKYYTLSIFTYEDDFEVIYSVDHPSEIGHRKNLSEMSLIQAVVTMGGVHNEILLFTMKQDKCFYTIDYDSKSLNTAVSLDVPGTVENTEWETVLSYFFNNLFVLIDKEIEYSKD